MKRNFNITKQSIAKFRYIQIGRAQTIISHKINRNENRVKHFTELVPVELIITKL